MADKSERLRKLDEADTLENETHKDGTATTIIPDGGYGWFVVFASFMCNLTVDGTCYTFGLFLPYFMHQFESSKSMTALSGSLLSGCYLFSGVFVSGLINRFGCRLIAIVGSFMASCAFVATTFMPNVYLLILTYGIVTGISFGLIYLPSIVSVGYYFSSKRGIATGIAVCGSGMGAFLFSPIVQVLLLLFDWKATMYFLAGAIIMVTLYGWLMKPLHVVGDQSIQKELDLQSGNTDKKPGSPAIFDFQILRLPAMLILSISNLFGMSGYYIPYFYIADFSENTVKKANGDAISPNDAAFLLSSIGVSNVLGRLMFGLLCDRIAHRRVLGMKMSALLQNNVCLSVSGLTVMAMPYCYRSYWLLFTDCVLFGTFIAPYMSLTSIILLDLFGIEHLSTTFGIISCCRGMSAIIGPPLAGLLFERTNSFTGMFLVAGCLLIMSSLTSFLAIKYEPNKQSSAVERTWSQSYDHNNTQC